MSMLKEIAGHLASVNSNNLGTCRRGFANRALKKQKNDLSGFQRNLPIGQRHSLQICASGRKRDLCMFNQHCEMSYKLKTASPSFPLRSKEGEVGKIP